MTWPRQTPFVARQPCISPMHMPPMHLYLPPGSVHTHRCPMCGKETVVQGPPRVTCG